MSGWAQVGVAVLGGIFGSNSAKKARRAAAAASRREAKIAADNLAFQKEQYQDWKDIYGDIQKNLGDYYERLGPDKIISLGLQDQQIEYQNTQETIKKNLAQRNIGGDKFEAYNLNNASINNANKRANIRSTAEEKVMQQKAGFLSIGLGNQQNLLSGISGAQRNQLQSAGNATTRAENRYANDKASNSKLIRDTLGQVGDALAINKKETGSYFGGSSTADDDAESETY